MKYVFIFLASISLVMVGGQVSAHEGVDHSTEAEAVAHEASLEQMEQVIELLKQVVALLIAKRDLVGQSSSVVIPIETTGPVEDAQMEEHHEEHGSESTSTGTPVAKLIVEIEAHNSSTHVHVRYVDKPEEMFFVEAALTDEDEIVRLTALRTGLSESEIREAVVYTGIH